MAAPLRETDLYAPIKALLASQGYEVKAEVGAADIVAVKDGEAPVIVEMKTGFSLALFHQAVERLKLTDTVYVAVPEWKGRTGWKAFRQNLTLCRRLGLGAITVRDGAAQVHLDPVPYKPRQSKARRERLLGEFQRRIQPHRRRDHAREHDAVIGRAHLDLLVGKNLAQPLLELGHVGRHADFDVGDQPARCIEQGQRRHARRLAEHIDGAVGQRRDVGDARVGNTEFREGDVAFDNDGPVHRDIQRSGGTFFNDCQRFCLGVDRIGAQRQSKPQKGCLE